MIIQLVLYQKVTFYCALHQCTDSSLVSQEVIAIDAMSMEHIICVKQL